LCQFLEAAHGFEATIDGRHLRSLLHGDLKPRNIRVLDGDRIKVLDFGIAKALSLSRKVTRNDFGSIAYLSPERLESGEIDAHADFWAVGVLLYEMVGGVQPFRAPDTRRLEQRIRSLRPAAPLEPPCPPGLQAIVAKLLAGDAADRYQDAAAIRAVGAAKADAYRQGIEAVGTSGYTAMQMASILGENKVKLVPDIAVSGDGTGGLAAAMVARLITEK
jgi:serine/threonine-protein kinase